VAEESGEVHQPAVGVDAFPVPSKQRGNSKRVAKMPHSAFSPECRVPKNAESHSGICWKRLERKHLAIPLGLCDSALFLVFPEGSIGRLETR
jgi:hypothetical protein